MLLLHVYLEYSWHFGPYLKLPLSLYNVETRIHITFFIFFSKILGPRPCILITQIPELRCVCLCSESVCLTCSHGYRKWRLSGVTPINFRGFHPTAGTDSIRLGPMWFSSRLHLVTKEWNLTGYRQTKSCAMRENGGGGGGKEHVKSQAENAYFS